MYTVERRNKIISLLEVNGQATVTALAAQLQVTPETIRRDLGYLAQRGILIRTHGGAIIEAQIGDQGYPFMVRETHHREEKNRICSRTAAFIEDGDTVFVDNSTTTINLLQHIPVTMRVTIITNSIKLILENSKLKNNITLVGTGGIVNHPNSSFGGSLTNKILHEFFPNKAFISCNGFHLDYGFTEYGLYEIDVKHQVLQLARQVFVLLDHSKIGKVGPLRLGDFSICSKMITDLPLPQDYLDDLHRSQQIDKLVICREDN